LQAAESSSLLGFSLEDRYTILREIGRGGMGVVYEAEHVELGKRIAVKVMLEKYANDDEAVVRFKREALAASRIGNPHIIDVSHIGAAPDGRPFVVMELLDGEPLAKILERTGPMPAWRAVHIMRQVLRAVGAAHAKGIIHRDLKPDNIFIVNRDDQHDFVKLLDFGISKMIDTSELAGVTRLTTTGMVMGTPLYMAPEQATGSPADIGVDIYAAGVILFEMLAGRPPFDETNYNVLIAKLLTATPPHLDDLRKGLPPPLVTAVHRALEKDPDHRYQSAEAFAQSLPSDRAISEPNLEILSTLGPDSSVHAAPSTLRKPAGKRAPWIIGAVAMAGAVTAVAIVANRSGSPATVSPPAPGSATGSATLAVTPAPGDAAPAPPSGRLEIKTIPPGAAVTIDKTPAGSTPLEVTLDPGEHHLHVELAGFATVDADETIHDAERTSAVITLVEAKPTKPGKPTKPTKPVLARPVITTTPLTKPTKPVTGPVTGPVNPYDPAQKGSNAASDTPVKPPTDTPTKPPNDTPTKPSGNGNGKPNPY
jgi:serine/threonine-protein kinase